MARYLSMFKYAAGAYGGTLKEGPTSRAEFLRSYSAEHESEVEAIWYSSGEWDMYTITNQQNDASALAGQWAALATGAFREAVVVQIFSPDEFQAGIDSAQGKYREPGA